MSLKSNEECGETEGSLVFLSSKCTMKDYCLFWIEKDYEKDYLHNVSAQVLEDHGH